MSAIFLDLTLRCPTCGRRADMCFDHGDNWKKRGTTQVSFCTCSDDCAADVDAHDENCPVEAELKRDFGF